MDANINGFTVYKSKSPHVHKIHPERALVGIWLPTLFYVLSNFEKNFHKSACTYIPEKCRNPFHREKCCTCPACVFDLNRSALNGFTGVKTGSVLYLFRNMLHVMYTVYVYTSAN